MAGGARNQSQFYDRFDAIVLLSAPAGVILDRVAQRTTNAYGKSSIERGMILADLAEVEPILRAESTLELDASRPLDAVVADLVAIASEPMTTAGSRAGLQPSAGGMLALKRSRLAGSCRRLSCRSRSQVADGKAAATRAAV